MSQAFNQMFGAHIYVPVISPMNLACTLGKLDPVNTPQQAGTPFTPTEAHKAAAAATQVSVVLMNWDRYRNVKALLQAYDKIDEIGEVCTPQATAISRPSCT